VKPLFLGAEEAQDGVARGEPLGHGRAIRSTRAPGTVDRSRLLQRKRAESEEPEEAMPTQRTVGALGLAASAVPAVAGLAASAMLAVDYLRPMPVFCSESGGCDALRHTEFAMPFGVPMPLLGLAGFLVLGIVSLWPGRSARAVQLVLATLAGLIGLALLVLQAKLGHFCPYCCVADTSGLLALGAAAWRRTQKDAEAPRGWIVGSALAMAATTTAPLVAGFRLDVTPQVIRGELAGTPPGDVTVIDFVDFECPFCRMTNEEFSPVIDSHRDRIRLLRKQVPLHMHPHAHDAARAACCGETLGKGDEMAEALFSAEVDDLTPEGCEKIAEKIGVPMDAYRACVANPATDARIDADTAEFKAAHGFALPTIWIGSTPLVGAQPQEVLAKAMHEALARVGS
jgi:uncharacterized membrane protein/predicted DsbA family dithiol-disulfide isomerase